jgi:hypothetical protein
MAGGPFGARRHNPGRLSTAGAPGRRHGPPRDILDAENSRFSEARPSAAKTLPCRSGLIRTGAWAAMRPANRGLWPACSPLDGRDPGGDGDDPPRCPCYGTTAVRLASAAGLRRYAGAPSPTISRPRRLCQQQTIHEKPFCQLAACCCPACRRWLVTPDCSDRRWQELWRPRQPADDQVGGSRACSRPRAPRALSRLQRLLDTRTGARPEAAVVPCLQTPRPTRLRALGHALTLHRFAAYLALGPISPSPRTGLEGHR